jgi:predicted lipoprotein with Yx(FWY)xxD motif
MATAIQAEGSSMFSHPPTTRRRRRPVLVLAAAAAVPLLASACGGDNSGGGGASAPVPHASSDAVSAQQTSLGTILVNDKGRTVYDFAADKGTTSTCTGSCASVWLPVSAPSPVPASLPGVTGSIGTTARPDGTHQLTVAGHPVYTFSGDSAPGQTNGQGVVLNGGLWTVVSPAGAPLPSAGPANSGPSY